MKQPKITIYATEVCPRCKVLTIKLEQRGLPYTKRTDPTELAALGIEQVPMMQVDNGPLMNLVEASKFLQQWEVIQ